MIHAALELIVYIFIEIFVFHFLIPICLVTGDIILFSITLGRKKHRLSQLGDLIVEDHNFSTFFDLSVWIGFVFWVIFLALLFRVIF